MGMTVMHALKVAAYVRHAALVWTLYPLDGYMRHKAMHRHLSFVDEVYSAWGV